MATGTYTFNENDLSFEELRVKDKFNKFLKCYKNDLASDPKKIDKIIYKYCVVETRVLLAMRLTKDEPRSMFGEDCLLCFITFNFDLVLPFY